MISRRIKPLQPGLALGVLLVIQSASAQEAAPLVTKDLKHPFFYSTSLMALSLPFFVAVGATDAGPSVNNLERAFSEPPRWDDDNAFTNFALHPLWGSETYLRAREGNWGIPGSIAFSMGMSVTWEYLFESWVSHPSTQDLIFTTGLGWGIGELRYRLKERASDRLDWLLDPIHKTLEHFHVVVARDKDGHLAGTVGVSIEF
jgi:hypothetical protein